MLDEMLMCVKADDVKFDEGYTTLLGPDNAEEASNFNDLLDSARFKHRDELEGNENYKQIVVYVVVGDGKNIYRYARSGGDDRLVGDYSIGIGGHVNVDDSSDSDFNHYDALMHAGWRELYEELDISHCKDQRGPAMSEVSGIINDNSNQVGRVHLGVVLTAELNGAIAQPIDENIHKAGLASIDELVQYLDDYESWSQILIYEIMKHH